MPVRYALTVAGTGLIGTLGLVMPDAVAGTGLIGSLMSAMPEAMAGTGLIETAGLVMPEAAAASPDPVGASTMTAGRLWSLVAVLIGLTGVVAAAVALVRRAGAVRRAGVTALVTGPVAAVIGAWVVAAAKGGPGTGYGIVGGYVALVVGLTATVLGTLVLARSRRDTGARPGAA